jgi:hypothetical protein
MEWTTQEFEFDSWQGKTFSSAQISVGIIGFFLASTWLGMQLTAHQHIEPSSKNAWS